MQKVPLGRITTTLISSDSVVGNALDLDAQQIAYHRFYAGVLPLVEINLLFSMIKCLEYG